MWTCVKPGQVQRPLGGRGMKTKSKARPDIPTDVNLDGTNVNCYNNRKEV